MKISFIRKSDGKVYGADELAPTTTATQHMQRVEEWTQHAQPVPLSNRKKAAKHYENEDLEAKSQLIIEAVRLLDSRDQQILSTPKPPPEPIIEEETEPQKVEETEEPEIDVGRHFRASGKSARTYVKQFEHRIKEKKKLEAAILDATQLPANQFTAARKGKKSRNKLNSTGLGARTAVDEPENWRYRMSRNVKFTGLTTLSNTGESGLIRNNSSFGGNEDDEKWTTKHENDREFWKWKLRQRFLQNDALLQKLTSQREKLEVGCENKFTTTSYLNLSSYCILLSFLFFLFA